MWNAEEHPFFESFSMINKDQTIKAESSTEIACASHLPGFVASTAMDSPTIKHNRGIDEIDRPKQTPDRGTTTTDGKNQEVGFVECIHFSFDLVNDPRRVYVRFELNLELVKTVNKLLCNLFKNFNFSSG